MDMVERKVNTILLTVELLSTYSICEENVPPSDRNVLLIWTSGINLRLDANSAFIFTTVVHVFPEMAGRCFMRNSMLPTRSCITPSIVTYMCRIVGVVPPIQIYGA